MNKRFGIFLEPDDLFFDYIMDWKKKFIHLENTQKYVNEIPHFTLLHGLYDNEDLLVKNFRNFTSFEKINIDSARPYIFYDDIQKGYNTLVFEFKNNNQIKSLQRLLLKKFKPSFSYKFVNLDRKYMVNLEKYHYPFVGDDLIPHVTITNIKIKNTHQLIKNFIEVPSYEKISFSKLYLGEIKEDYINKIYEISP